MAVISRAISEDGGIFAAAIDNTDVVEKIQEIWTPSPAGLIAMGRLAAGASVFGSLLKNDDDRITIRFDGNNVSYIVGGCLTAVADQYGNVKVCADNPQAVPPRDPLSAAEFTGRKGNLIVIKDLGLREHREIPFSATVPIISGEIAADLTNYFGQSEQIPTAVSLGVLLDTEEYGNVKVKKAGGFLLQCLPPVADDKLHIIEKNLAEFGKTKITKLLADGLSAEEISLKLLDGLNPNILDVFECKYRCDCSQDKTHVMLESMGKKTATEVFGSKNEVEVGCNFCGKKYIINKSELSFFKE